MRRQQLGQLLDVPTLQLPPPLLQAATPRASTNQELPRQETRKILYRKFMNSLKYLKKLIVFNKVCLDFLIKIIFLLSLGIMNAQVARFDAQKQARRATKNLHVFM